MPATPAAAMSEVIDVKDASAWYQGALGELLRPAGRSEGPPCRPGRRHLRQRPVLRRTRRSHGLRALQPRTGAGYGRVSRLCGARGRAGRHRAYRRPYRCGPGLRIARHLRHRSCPGVDGPIREYYLIGPPTPRTRTSGAPRSAGRSSPPAAPATGPPARAAAAETHALLRRQSRPCHGWCGRSGLGTPSPRRCRGRFLARI